MLSSLLPTGDAEFEILVGRSTTLGEVLAWSASRMWSQPHPKRFMLRHGNAQLKLVATRTLCAQQIGQREYIRFDSLPRLVQFVGRFLSENIFKRVGYGQKRSLKKVRTLLQCSVFQNETCVLPRRRDGRCLSSARLATPRTACGIVSKMWPQGGWHGGSK